MTDNETPMFPVEDSDHDDRIEMGAAHITNEVVGLLHEALLKSGLTRRELAARLGIGESRVSQVLNGDGNLRLTTIGRFLAAMNCKVDMVVRDFDTPKPRRRARSRGEQRQSVSVWGHSVTSEAGCYNAFVVAPGMSNANDVIHQTGGLVFDSGTLPGHSYAIWADLKNLEVSTFKAPWSGDAGARQQEPALNRQESNA